MTKTLGARKTSIQVITILILILSVITVLHPEVRSHVRNGLRPDYRVVLSTVSGDIFGKGIEGRVLKIKTQTGLFLEVYSASSGGKSHLVQTIHLPHQRDAYFTYSGEATNLALDDVNSDGRVEVLVPGLSENLTATLSVYEYDEKLRELKELQASR